MIIGTPTGLLAEIETVLTRFRPAWVDIFMLTPTQTYVTGHFGGSWDAFWQHMKAFEAAVPAALPDLAKRTGYVIRVGHGHHMMLMRGDAWSDAAGSDGGEGAAGYSYTALTTEANSASTESPGALTMRPPAASTWPAKTARRSVRARSVAWSSSCIRRL